MGMICKRCQKWHDDYYMESDGICISCHGMISVLKDEIEVLEEFATEAEENGDEALAELYRADIRKLEQDILKGNRK